MGAHRHDGCRRRRRARRLDRCARDSGLVPRARRARAQGAPARARGGGAQGVSPARRARFNHSGGGVDDDGEHRAKVRAVRTVASVPGEREVRVGDVRGVDFLSRTPRARGQGRRTRASRRLGRRGE